MLRIATLLVLFAFPGLADDITGKARVIDGDTIEVGGQRIRLHGLDAPELRQTCLGYRGVFPCGEHARRMLSREADGQEVTCQERGQDRYGRVLAVCHVEGLDLGAHMVRLGWALAYREYSLDYVDAEKSAKALITGLWRTRFVPPWEWRRGKRLELPEQADISSRCPIKGNLGRGGERIYHVPGGQYYGRTKIDQSKGERWFCTEEEATAAGGRKSSR